MNDPTLIFLTWMVLCIIMISFVIYRLITDRKTKSENQHSFFPMTSNPGDKMFSDSKDTIGWVAYIFMVIGFIAFLSIIFMLIFYDDFPTWLIHVFGVFFFIGALLQGANTTSKKVKK